MLLPIGDDDRRLDGPAYVTWALLIVNVGVFAQIFLDPDGVVPSLGASGAISGVLGAYLVLFPRNRVRAILFYFVVSLPAVAVIGFYIALEFLEGFGATMASEGTVGGVAYGAHIGGFFAGLAMALVLRGLIGSEDGGNARSPRRGRRRR